MACCPEGAYCADLNMVPCGGYGQCMMRPGYCWGDYDCAQGEHCEYPYYDDYPAPCADGTDCTGGAPKMVAEPGSCVPDAQPACYSDQDCPAGQFCDFGVSGPVEGCCGPWDEICLMIYPACEGVCEPRLPDGLCLDDADCAAGQACDFSNPLCVEQECYPNGECLGGCYGQCVAAQQGCTWDGDCAAGEYCAFTDWCGGARTDPDGNGQEMPAWCGEGVCTPVVVPQDCQRGGCSGELCVPYGTGVDSDCMWQPWYLCYDLARCERTPDGTCGWMGSTQFYNCMKENGAF
jgi:eight-cysteine-cluster-containing protein